VSPFYPESMQPTVTRITQLNECGSGLAARCETRDRPRHIKPTEWWITSPCRSSLGRQPGPCGHTGTQVPQPRRRCGSAFPQKAENQTRRQSTPTPLDRGRSAAGKSGQPAASWPTRVACTTPRSELSNGADRLGQGVVSAADPRAGLARITAAAVFGFNNRVMKITAHGVDRR
jgi:hypothetical protein